MNEPEPLADAISRQREATDTPTAIAAVGRMLASADPTHPIIAALRAVIALAEPTPGGNHQVMQASSPICSPLISAAEAARSCRLTKETMVKRLRRLGIGQKVVGRWYVDRDALRAHCPELRD